MSARRLKETALGELGDWARHVVIAGYANGYAGYVTTPEEYMIQQYEAGHTLHGRWTLPAYRQVTARLAEALESGDTLSQDIAFDDWRGRSESVDVHDGTWDALPGGAGYGQALALDKKTFVAGEIVSAAFWSANPSADLLRPLRYVRVEHNKDGDWIEVASDSDWSTKIQWHEDATSKALIANVSWQTPEDIESGTYRIRHTGVYTDDKGDQHAFDGISDHFEIVISE